MELPQSFWDRVEKIAGASGCWLWTGALTKLGYGEWQKKRVHRRMWEYVHGQIPSGPHLGTMCICHRCDVRSCCNPDHLFLGTQQDNMADAWVKGRMNYDNSKRPRKITKEMAQKIIEEKWTTPAPVLAKQYKVIPLTIYRTWAKRP